MKPYYTLVIYRTVAAFTNEWNACPPGWTSQTRGNFPTEQAALERAREILPHGAPFSVRCVAPGEV
jgi:hypothetical protein